MDSESRMDESRCDIEGGCDMFDRSFLGRLVDVPAAHCGRPRAEVSSRLGGMEFAFTKAQGKVPEGASGAYRAEMR